MSRIDLISSRPGRWEGERAAAHGPPPDTLGQCGGCARLRLVRRCRRCAVEAPPACDGCCLECRCF